MTVRGHELVSDDNRTDTVPTPLEMARASLMGCEGVIINRCADAMGFTYSAVHMEVEGAVDQRSSRGVQSVRPYINWVRLKIRFTSAESPKLLDKLAKNLEYRCLVVNLFRKAGVDAEADWQLVWNKAPARANRDPRIAL